jgi:hypothetical protein
MNFTEWFATSPLASALRVFVAIVLAAAIADWSTKGTIDFGAWQTWVIAALVSAVPVITRWLNPYDPAFGRGSTAEDSRFDVFGDE